MAKQKKNELVFGKNELNSSIFFTFYSNTPYIFYVSSTIRKLIRSGNITKLVPSITGSANYNDENDKSWKLEIELKSESDISNTLHFEPQLVSEEIGSLIQERIIDFRGLDEGRKDKSKVKIYFNYEDGKLVSYLNNNNLF